MKRFKLLLIAITSIVLAFALTGCSNKKNNFSRQAYSSAETTIQAINIDVIDREITVSLSEDNQVHIDYFESKKEYYNISVAENNILNLQFFSNKKWHDFVGANSPAEYRKINLKIPYALLSNLTIKTTNENIKLSPLVVADNISLYSNGGNIEFEQIDVGKSLSMTAKNGNIKGSIIGSYDTFSIACTIKKGKCNLPLQKTDGDKSLKINCNNGDTEIDFIKA